MSEILEVKIPENCPVCGRKWHPYKYLKDQNLERIIPDFDTDQNGKIDDQIFKCECNAVFCAKWVLVSFKEVAVEKQDGENSHA
jgi:hypothetical protein